MASPPRTIFISSDGEGNLPRRPRGQPEAAAAPPEAPPNHALPAAAPPPPLPADLEPVDTLDLCMRELRLKAQAAAVRRVWAATRSVRWNAAPPSTHGARALESPTLHVEAGVGRGRRVLGDAGGAGTACRGSRGYDEGGMVVRGRGSEETEAGAALITAYWPARTPHASPTPCAARPSVGTRRRP